ALPSNVHVGPLQTDVKAAVGGVSTGVPPKIESRSRFGEPVPVPDSLLTLALLTIAAWTVLGDASGSVARYSAAAPVTCGVAIEVPLIVLVAVLLVIHADVMLDPGANRSTQVP